MVTLTVELQADEPKRCWREIYGMLKGKGNGAKLSIDEIADAIAKAGAEAGEASRGES